MQCNVCPRKCNIDLNKARGYCGKSKDKIKVAKVMRHFWEEPIISGKKGSGAIFFSFCNLKCCYCQNYQISHEGVGKDFSVTELANLFKEIESKNVENLNLVTPSHYADKILEAFEIYKPQIPIVWNTSGYDLEETIEKLSGKVDIFLFDFKYFDEEKSKLYSSAKNYFDITLKAIKMARKIIPKDIVENGIMKKGIIIRHLVLPKMYKDSEKIFEEILKNFGNDTYISLMSQYVPFYKSCNFEELKNKLSVLEYKKVVSFVKKLGFNKGYIQDFSSATCDYTPNFDIEKFYEF